MTREERHAAIRAEVARCGRVLSLRRMVRALQVRHGVKFAVVTVQRDYAALGLQPHQSRAGRTVAVCVHLPEAMYDRLCRTARLSGQSLSAVVREAFVESGGDGTARMNACLPRARSASSSPNESRGTRSAPSNESHPTPSR